MRLHLVVGGMSSSISGPSVDRASHGKKLGLDPGETVSWSSPNKLPILNCSHAACVGDLVSSPKSLCVAGKTVQPSGCHSLAETCPC